MNAWTYRMCFFFLFFFSFFSCKKSKEKQTNSTNIIKKEAQLVYLDSLVNYEPKNSEHYYNRSKYHFNKNNMPKALVDISNALKIDSLNESYYYLGGEIFIALNQGNKANILLAKGINLMPNNEPLYLQAIEYNLYMHNYEAALNYTNDLLRKNKYNTEAYYLKGFIYQDLKQIDKAISSWQTAIEIDPNHYDSQMQLALNFSRKKDPLAIQYFENALRITPNDRSSMYGIAYHYQQEKQYKKAKAEYVKILKLNPKDHEVLYNIGHCYLKLDSLSKAYKHFDIAVKMQPQYTGAYYMKGFVSESLGNYEDALFNYEQAQSLMPENKEIEEAIKRLKKNI